LEGEPDSYVGDEAFNVQTWECIFLAKLIPHGWIILWKRIRMLALFTLEASKKLSAVQIPQLSI